MSPRRAACGLLILGLLQMTGDVLAIPVLKGLGAATAASPAPRVFTSRRGLETYSSRFALEWTDRDGGTHVLELTPDSYARIRGPYNRRNVYGAVLAAGPALAADSRTAPLFHAVATYALCGEAPLLRELGVDPADLAGPPRVRIEPRPGGNEEGLPTEWTPPCP